MSAGGTQAGVLTGPTRPRRLRGEYERPAMVGLLLLWLAASAHPACSQELAHFEGYLINSAVPATNPNAGVKGLEGRGLVTAIFAPAAANFTANEYTWVLKGLVPVGSNVSGTTTYTTYDTTASSLVLYQDPSQDARPTFYDCPADILPSPPGDPRYSDGSVFYITWHFRAFMTTYDASTHTGTFSGSAVLDPGQPYRRLACIIVPGDGPVVFDGTTSADFACIPTTSGYDQAVTARLFCLFGCCPYTPARGTSWGRLRQLYR